MNESNHPRVLGSVVPAPDYYDAAILDPIQRPDRVSGVWGIDRWRCYEVAWRQPNGVPVVGMCVIDIPAHSKYTVESKSLKLYLNGWAYHCIDSEDEFIHQVSTDLTNLAQEEVSVTWIPLTQSSLMSVTSLDPKTCIDAFDFSQSPQRQSSIFKWSGDESVSQSFHSHAFQSICPVTGQPDWATICVDLTGPVLDPGSLLAYLCSFQTHGAFHETCIESIYQDIWSSTSLTELTVQGAFTRRGGIDINPCRSSHQNAIVMGRLIRQ